MHYAYPQLQIPGLKTAWGGETGCKAALKIFPKKLASFATEKEEVQA